MPPKQQVRGKKRQRRGAPSSTPPEDLIEEGRRQDILRVFQEYSSGSNDNNDGDTKDATLSFTDTKKALKELQLVGIKQEEIKAYFGVDKDDRTSILSLDADMFLRFAAAKTIQHSRAQKAFGLMDEAQKGVVVLEDLERVATDLGENLTTEEITEMIDYIDRSGEGLLTLSHFFKIARKVNL
mmetsp:Transcript_9845/g.17982  ORF Transcript_9845/g.17982 Transcript_9845/m.17982 type:complete len:183 (+) Transcript_9845:75-623(+)